jgi:hypothetical protein
LLALLLPELLLLELLLAFGLGALFFDPLDLVGIYTLPSGRAKPLRIGAVPDLSPRLG